MYMSVNVEIIPIYIEVVFCRTCAYLGNIFAKNEIFPKKMAGYSAIFFIEFKTKVQTLHLVR